MKLSLTQQEIAFKDEIKEFIDKHLPAHVRLKPTEADIKRWQEATANKGWSVVNWPVEYGGTGWNSIQRHLWSIETAKASCPLRSRFATDVLGPLLMEHGSELQKSILIPEIRAGVGRWCHGYSEITGESGLTPLNLEATLIGNTYRLSGTKPYISAAETADWMLCLVRTNEHEKGNNGLSFLIIDMHTPGISTTSSFSPVKDQVINSVQFDRVDVPITNLLGKENCAESFMEYLLNSETSNFTCTGRSRTALTNLKTVAKNQLHESSPLSEDAKFSNKIANMEVQLLALEAIELRIASRIQHHHNSATDPLELILKIRNRELQQALAEQALEASGYYALPYFDNTEGQNEPPIGAESISGSNTDYFAVHMMCLHGGPIEYHRDLIAKSILGLY